MHVLCRYHCHIDSVRARAGVDCSAGRAGRQPARRRGAVFPLSSFDARRSLAVICYILPAVIARIIGERFSRFDIWYGEAEERGDAG